MDDARDEVARRSRGTPRIANRLLRRVRDFAHHLGTDGVPLEAARFGLEQMEVDAFGLDHLDRKLLTTIIDVYNGGPVGLKALAAPLVRTAAPWKTSMNRICCRSDFCNGRPVGGSVTPLAYRHLGLEPARRERSSRRAIEIHPDHRQPHRRGGSTAADLSADLDAAALRCGVETRMATTEHPRSRHRAGATGGRRGRPLVFAYGGDGTYNEVARGLLGSDTALGILPGGTTSVLAYEFGIPRPATRAVEALIIGRDRPMRVGRTDRDEIFLIMFSSGPDVVVLEKRHGRDSKRSAAPGVALQAFREFARFRSMPSFEVVPAARHIPGRAGRSSGQSDATPGPTTRLPAPTRLPRRLKSSSSVRWADVTQCSLPSECRLDAISGVGTCGERRSTRSSSAPWVRVRFGISSTGISRGNSR